jgi:CRP/FNR family transcriptional regulator, cyclic AMP receptor protein
MDASLLRTIPMFAVMDDQDLHRIATFASSDSAAAGTILIREGDFSTEMVAIEDGTADVLRGEERVATLGPGDVFGEMGVLEKALRTATVVATSRVRLIKLTTWDVKRLSPEVRERLREVIDQRHESDRVRVEAPAGPDAP